MGHKMHDHCGSSTPTHYEQNCLPSWPKKEEHCNSYQCTIESIEPVFDLCQIILDTLGKDGPNNITKKRSESHPQRIHCDTSQEEKSCHRTFLQHNLTKPSEESSGPKIQLFHLISAFCSSVIVWAKKNVTSHV